VPLHAPSPARSHLPNTMCPSLARPPVADAPLPSPSRPAAHVRLHLPAAHFTSATAQAPTPPRTHPARVQTIHPMHYPAFPVPPPRRCVYPAHSSSRPNVATAPHLRHATAARSCPSRLPRASYFDPPCPAPTSPLHPVCLDPRPRRSRDVLPCRVPPVAYASAALDDRRLGAPYPPSISTIFS
jgi:hypothetical protein